ncbi:MAG: hypothetical protein MUC49_14030 [Raineya sp.]|jgi:hypothetical protein|nr:hypothetical protein [Raineya sp.]
MKYRILLITTLFILIFLNISCGQKGNTEFPNQIQTKKTDKHIRIKGTKVFAIIPKDFEYVSELARYQKDKNLYIQVIESNSSNFIEAKPTFTKETIEAKGAKVDVSKNIKFNDFESIYVEGPSKYDGETKLMMAFGDETFLVMIVGVFKTGDNDSREILRQILKSTYYDKSLQLDFFELSNFEFDESITNFQYAMSASNMFLYAENGKSDINNPIANSLLFAVMPQMSEEQAEAFFYDLCSRHERDKMQFENKNIIRTSINNYKAIVLESKIKKEGNSGVLYQVILLTEKSTLAILAIAYNDVEAYLDKFKRTVESVKLK